MAIKCKSYYIQQQFEQIKSYIGNLKNNYSHYLIAPSERMINSKLRFIDDNYSLQMPKLFEGSQFIRILLKDKNGYSLTKKLPCEDYYEDAAISIMNAHDLKPKDLKVLKYQMVRKPPTNYLKVVAIFYVECENRLPENLLSKKENKLNYFKSFIKQELPSAKIFDAEGNNISLIKKLI